MDPRIKSAGDANWSDLARTTIASRVETRLDAEDYAPLTETGRSER